MQGDEALTPEEWMIYRTHDKTEPAGNIAHYGSRIVAGLMNQIGEWRREMPARYQSFTGIENADATDLANMRQQVADEFTAAAMAWMQMAQVQAETQAAQVQT